MAPTLSVIVPVTHDSETLRPLLHRLAPQIRDVDGELVVADGSASGLDGVDVALRLPGANVFALRAAACDHVSAPIVTFTEDHCLPAGDWCRAVLTAHLRHFHKAAVAGCMTNGSGGSAMNWANFLLTFAPFLPPLPPLTASRVAPGANVSFKTEVLREYDLPPGFVELELLPHLQRVGQLVYDDAVRVAHDQPRGRREAIAMHFHNGRCATSLPPRRRPLGESMLRLARAATLSPRLVGHVLREVGARQAYRRVTLRALPSLVLLALAHALGESVGLLFGAGHSPERLE